MTFRREAPIYRIVPLPLVLVAVIIAVAPAASQSARGSDAADSDASALRAAMHRALGGDDSLRFIRSIASVHSPSGEFETRLAAAADGRIRLAIGKGFRAGINAAGGWHCDSTGKARPLDPATLTFVHGHDLHLLVLAPDWLGPPVVEQMRRWRGDSVLVLRYRDELGEPLRLFLRVTDTMPVGLQVVNHTGSGARDVDVEIGDWITVSGHRLFRQATFIQADDRYHYTYRELDPDALPEEAFAPRCG